MHCVFILKAQELINGFLEYNNNAPIAAGFPGFAGDQVDDARQNAEVDKPSANK